MAIISNLITELRTDLSDDGSTRWTDAQLLSLFKKAIRRANRIVQRHGVQFAKKFVTLTTIPNQSYIDMSVAASDFDTWIGLYRNDIHNEIPRRNEREWETIISAPEIGHCLLDQTNSRIYFNNTPTVAYTLTLWYFPSIDPSGYTTASSTPWDGRLDDIILEYVRLRALNIDEMDISADQAMLADMEQQILQAYAWNTPNISEGLGWL